MAKAPRPAPTVIEAIDRCLMVVNGSKLEDFGSAADMVSRGLVIKLLEAREIAESMQGFLAEADGAAP